MEGGLRWGVEGGKQQLHSDAPGDESGKARFLPSSGPVARSDDLNARGVCCSSALLDYSLPRLSTCVFSGNGASRQTGFGWLAGCVESGRAPLSICAAQHSLRA